MADQHNNLEAFNKWQGVLQLGGSLIVAAVSAGMILAAVNRLSTDVTELKATVDAQEQRLRVVDRHEERLATLEKATTEMIALRLAVSQLQIDAAVAKESRGRR